MEIYHAVSGSICFCSFVSHVFLWFFFFSHTRNSLGNRWVWNRFYEIVKRFDIESKTSLISSFFCLQYTDKNQHLFSSFLKLLSPDAVADEHTLPRWVFFVENDLAICSMRRKKCVFYRSFDDFLALSVQLKKFDGKKHWTVVPLVVMATQKHCTWNCWFFSRLFYALELARTPAKYLDSLKTRRNERIHAMVNWTSEQKKQHMKIESSPIHSLKFQTK